MFTRLLAATFCLVVIGGTYASAQDETKQKKPSICKGLNQTDCSAKTECRWNAKKAACKENKEDESKENKEEESK